MKIFAAATLAVAIATSASAAIKGVWTAAPGRDGKLYVSMSREPGQQNGVSYRPSELGLSADVLRATTSTPITLHMQHDAGTLTLEGTFKDGYGAGQFSFAPNRAYIDALRSIGVQFDVPEERSEDDVLFWLSVIDLSVDYARTMRQLFPGATLRELRKLRAVDVTPQYIADLASAGYANLSIRDVTRLAATGVDAEFIRRMSKVKQ